MATTSIKIPYQQITDPPQARVLNLFQTQLASALSPITNLPMCKSTILTNKALAAGANTIQTQLGYPLSGFYIIRQRAQADIWDSQDGNSDPSNTLILNSSAAVVVDLVIF